jgi:hypothetical protein
MDAYEEEGLLQPKTRQKIELGEKPWNRSGAGKGSRNLVENSDLVQSQDADSRAFAHLCATAASMPSSFELFAHPWLFLMPLRFA